MILCTLILAGLILCCLHIGGLPVEVATLALMGVLLAGLALRKWSRGRREIDQAMAMVCKTCQGGTVPCAVKCANPLCPAEDTSVRTWSADELAALRGERELPS